MIKRLYNMISVYLPTSMTAGEVVERLKRHREVHAEWCRRNPDSSELHFHVRYIEKYDDAIDAMATQPKWLPVPRGIYRSMLHDTKAALALRGDAWNAVDVLYGLQYSDKVNV